MSFRTKVFLSITTTVVVSVWIVASVVSTLVTNSFERQDMQRTAALVSQFRSEFDRRSVEVARRVDAIANSEVVQRLAVNLGASKIDTAQYYDAAQALAKEQSLSFLELVAPEGSIISSAEWPARFGYKESWLLQPIDWKSQGVFLQREELADGPALGLMTVRSLNAGDGQLYVAGGQRLDKAFLDSLPPAPGMNIRLVRDFDAPPPSDPPASKLAADLIRDVRQSPRELSLIGADVTLTAIPLLGRDKQLLAVLMVENSRAELANLKTYIQGTAWIAGSAGVLLGLGFSFWAASRVTQPLLALASNVRDVASGNWDARARIDSTDEVGQLAQDFNRMTEQLVEQRDRMIQAERVAAWRELARRLAHELKNPLFPLQITIENLQRARQTSPQQFDEVFRESTTTLLAELDNLKTIVGRFSDFARMPAPHPEPVDLNHVVQEVAQLFDPQMQAVDRPRIVKILQLDDNLPLVSADPEQIRRALRNLVLNALDAMPNGGTLTLRTQRLDGPVDRKVALEVSDTGAGLTPEECARLFTPYYTTKQHGTGLGLAIVQSVVSDHKGTITVRSEPGKGATFRIELRA
ncbi:MAG TPA: ATP-binding protein [Bryobacteraceae bacterium]|nr:ATP-binding protein [Bryobacteraceae bacterium]